MDCGLLIEKKRQGKPQWSICPACVRVYSEVKHKWLASMLAKRVMEQQGLLAARAEMLQKNNVYYCKDCHRFYLAIKDIESQQMQCRWCFVYEKKTGSPLKSRREKTCIVCYGETGGQAVCDNCFSKMRIVKKSMEYTYFITWLGRYMREPVFEAGKMTKKGLKQEKINMRERIPRE
jgi:hypothetical protein